MRDVRLQNLGADLVVLSFQRRAARLVAGVAPAHVEAMGLANLGGRGRFNPKLVSLGRGRRQQGHDTSENGNAHGPAERPRFFARRQK